MWDVTVFTKNRERLLKSEVAQGFFHAVVEQARAQGLLSDEHFTVDGTLIEAWAGHKSFKRKADDRQIPPDDPGNPSVDFHGERRRNATHQSTTDPEAGLALVEEIAGFGRVTLGADKGYDQKELVRELRAHRVTPHVAQKPNSAIDGRTTRRPGFLLSHRRRKRVEEISAGSRPWAGCARLVIVESLSRLDLHLCCYRLQPGQDAQPEPCRHLKPPRGAAHGHARPQHLQLSGDTNSSEQRKLVTIRRFSAPCWNLKRQKRSPRIQRTSWHLFTLQCRLARALHGGVESLKNRLRAPEPTMKKSAARGSALGFRSGAGLEPLQCGCQFEQEPVAELDRPRLGARHSDGQGNA